MTLPPLAGRIPARLGLLASAVLFGAVCVHAWRVLDGARPPRPAAPALPVPDGAPGIDIAAVHLFGQGDAPAPASETAPPPNLVLTGVIAAQPGRPAVALLIVDGKSQALRPGDPIVAGWTLQAVERDRVVLDQGGARSELLLANGRTAAVAPPGPGLAGPVGGPPSLRPGGAAQPFRLDVQSLGPNHMSFSRAELNRGLQDPRQAAALGRATPAPGGGLLLEEVPPGSLPERIGLHSSDVLRLANGQALNNLTDLPRLYQEFGNAAEVRLEITRGGQPTMLQYTLHP